MEVVIDSNSYAKMMNEQLTQKCCCADKIKINCISWRLAWNHAT